MKSLTGCGFNYPCSCGGPTQVIDSRGAGESLRRRRKCKRCGAKVTTYEVPADRAQEILTAINEWDGPVP
jgi:transcriptional regulator NrdR family protein